LEILFRVADAPAPIEGYSRPGSSAARPSLGVLGLGRLQVLVGDIDLVLKGGLIADPERSATRLHQDSVRSVERVPIAHFLVRGRGFRLPDGCYFGPTAQPAIVSTLGRARRPERVPNSKFTLRLCRLLIGHLLRHLTVQPLRPGLVVRRDGIWRILNYRFIAIQAR